MTYTAKFNISIVEFVHSDVNNVSALSSQKNDWNNLLLSDLNEINWRQLETWALDIFMVFRQSSGIRHSQIFGEIFGIRFSLYLINLSNPSPSLPLILVVMRTIIHISLFMRVLKYTKMQIHIFYIWFWRDLLAASRRSRTKY